VFVALILVNPSALGTLVAPEGLDFSQRFRTS